MLRYQPSKSADQNLTNLQPNFGSFSNLGSPKFRAEIWGTLTTIEAINRIIGSVQAAPSRPPVAAVESLLADHVGDEAFEDEAKKMIGRLVRQIVEHLGGRLVRRGVPLNIPSKFRKGSIYSFA
jgi:hypothetical protein